MGRCPGRSQQWDQWLLSPWVPVQPEHHSTPALQSSSAKPLPKTRIHSWSPQKRLSADATREVFPLLLSFCVSVGEFMYVKRVVKCLSIFSAYGNTRNHILQRQQWMGRSPTGSTHPKKIKPLIVISTFYFLHLKSCFLK